MFNKWLKTCSVLPALLITPALAGVPVNVLPGVEETTEDNIYENNEVASGSGVYEVGGILNVANGTVFKNNKGDIGGAISVLKKSAGNPTGGLLNVGENVVFEGNTAIYDGGAIGNYGGSIISKNVTFKNNHSGVGLDGSETLTDNNPIGGGAISLGIDAVLDITNGNFEGNTSAYDGGAIGTRRTLVPSEVTGFDNIAHSINIKNTSFSNNEAKGITADEKNGNFAGGNGGAIATTFKNAAISDSEFVGNVAAANGGAIYNHKLVATTSGTPTGLGGILSLNNNVFKSNKANKGGAIYNDSTISLTGDTQFVENSASNTGGAIFNASEGIITEISNALFQGNKAEAYKDSDASLTGDVYAQGGAIYNLGEIGAVTGDFILNSASADAYANGGAIYIGTGSDTDVNIGMITGHFKGNKVVATTKQAGLPAATGGAISINVSDGKTASISTSGNFVSNSVSTEATLALGGALYNEGTATLNSHFANNYVVSGSANANGGAIYNSGTINLAEKRTFFGNRAGYAGGAIYNLGQLGNLQGTLFQNNIAQLGGAINNDVDTDNSLSGNIALISDANFNGNIASNGGAIRNLGTISEIQETVFDNNMSSAGGAIWNGTSGVITDISNITFVDNTAETGKAQNGGAIFNSNIIGNISNVVFNDNEAGKNGGAIYNDTTGSITFSGNNFFFDNSVDDVANDIHNLGNITIASGATTLTGGITGNSGVLTVNDGATLNIGTSTISQATLNINGTIAATLINSSAYGKLNGNLVAGSSSMLDLNIGTVGTYNVFDSDIGSMGLKYNKDLYNISVDGGKLIVKTNSVENVASAINLSYDTAGVLVGLANSNSYNLGLASLNAQKALADGNTNYVQSEASKLMGDSAPIVQSITNNLQKQVVSLSSSRISKGQANQSYNDTDSTNQYGLWAQGIYNMTDLSGAFDGETRGFAAGMDALVKSRYTFGLGYIYNMSEMKADSRDIDVASNALFGYMQYKPNNWYVNASLNYIMSSYTEEMQAFGVDIDSEYNVNAFGGQLATGYDFSVGITPELSVRYMYASQEDYNNGLANIKTDDFNFLTGVAGIKYAKDFTLMDKVIVAPEVKLSAAYDILSDGAVVNLLMPGGREYTAEGEALNPLSGEVGLGLSVKYEQLNLSLNYSMEIRKDYSSQTGMLKLKYVF